MLNFKLMAFGLCLLSIQGISQVLLTATGTNNTFNIQYPANIVNPTPGLMVTFFSNQTLTSGGASINLNGSGAKNLFKNVNQLMGAGDILAGQAVGVIFDGTNWQFLGTNVTAPWTANGNYLFPTNTTLSVAIGSANGGKVPGASTYLSVVAAEVYGGNKIPSLELQGSSSFVNGVIGKVDFVNYSNFSPILRNIARIEVQQTNTATQGQMLFYVNNGTTTAPGEVMRISSTGNLGIGTTSPANNLHVVGGVRISTIATPVWNYLQANSNGDIVLGGPASVSSFWALGGNTLAGISNIGTISNHDLPFITNGVERMRIDSQGDIGIHGAPYVGWPLTVYDAGNNEALQVDNLGVKIGDVGGNSLTNYFYTDFESAGNFQFINGNVGIGTTAPGANLDVNGTFRLGTGGTILSSVIKATVNKTLPTIASGAGSQQTFTVPGATTGSSVFVSPSGVLSVAIGSAYVSSANTVTVIFLNTLSSSYAGGTMNFYITVFK